MDSWQHAWTALVIIFVGGLIVGKLSEKPRIPDVAAYLVYGIIIGPAVLNLLSEPSQSNVNQFILNFGATLILFEGGRGVSLSVLRRVWVSISLLVTLGVFVSTFVVGLAVHLLLGTPWVFSLLVGAVIASTDPATLIPVFRRVYVLPILRQTVESESAFNDATGTVLTMTLLAATTGGSIHVGTAVVTFVSSAVLGLLIGIVLGLIALILISRKAWGLFHEYGSFVLLITAISSYQLASTLHASGFMAAFVAGIVAGNAQTFKWTLASHTTDNIMHFGNAMTLMMRMLIFVLLGTQVNFTVVHQYLWAGLLIVAVFMLIARPASVLSSVLFDRRAAWQGREVTFMCWVRETGVIPAALSGMLVAKGVKGADVISAITFMAILLTILIQASTTGVVAKWLGVLGPSQPQEEV
ncbi:cation:proton antiporter [Alicyclobacillus sp. ALC3]|uniref:cation:proton antiporter n=1 Tax=Alicyclobacillus sp. ALC3 TaxID=2796143 RepID=UPI002378D868|nr:cation:proton antiporter [Alicyclobacillus sp. ALC3]WDL99580.1 cation:proton antiporter [Alicyclobacillus sp. ALC3]